MFSKSAAKKKIGEREGFRWRGSDISRVESLSDAVFAFSVTLLIVSTEVPHNFNEFLLKLRDFVPFAACFMLLMSVWYLHYQFYRRYNIQDLKSTVLTMALLFLVLFYTYPLKFVFQTWWLSVIAEEEANKIFTSYDQVRLLFEIYAVGFIAVWVVFVLLYDHAYRLRDQLQLTELEMWDTIHVRREAIMFIFVGILAMVLAMTVPDEFIGATGIIYALLGVIGSIHGSWSGNRRREIHARLYPSD